MGRWEVFLEFRVSVWDDEKVLDMDGVVVAQHHVDAAELCN